MDANRQAARFSAIFRAFMVFCVLVWLWGLGLYLFWPWQNGGNWLPEYPIVVTCADGSACALPIGELAAARAAGRVSSVQPPAAQGETAYEMLTVRWQQQGQALESRASAWNFQTTVRYRIDDGQPVLLEYQEINGRIFLFALGGALISLILLYLRKLRR